MFKSMIIILFCLFSYSVSAQGFGAGVNEIMIMEKGNQLEEKAESNAAVEAQTDSTVEESAEEEVPVANIQEPDPDITSSDKAESSEGSGVFVPIIIISGVLVIATIVILNLRKNKS